MPEYKSIRTKGVLEERRLNSGRFRVLGFKRQGQFVYDPEEIKKEFLPNGFVFAPGIFNNPKFTEDTIWEFYAIPGDNIIAGGDIMFLDSSRDYTKLDFQVFDIYEDVMVTAKQFNQPLLNRYFNEVTSKFYIHQKETLYGPFKTVSGEVVPELGRHVNLFGRLPRIHEINGRQYLLELPSENNIIEKIECYTRSQLADWFRREVRASGLKIDWNEWEHLLGTWNDNGEGLGRFNQVGNFMEELRLSHQEIKTLADSSATLKNMYKQSINDIRELIRQEELIPLLREKEVLEKEILSLNTRIATLQEESETLNKQRKKLTEEYQFINEEKDRLINDIKIHTTVAEKTNTSSVYDLRQDERLQTFEVRVFEKTGDVYPDLKSFAKKCEALFGEDVNVRKQGMLSFFQLRQYKAILCKQVDWVIQFARLTNNCKLFIQQVEADWLKYECLYRNGLRQCWESAVKNPEIIHFFLLEDINLSSIECYGRPFLDLLANRRQKLPGLDESWPPNVWLFGAPLELDKQENFGLPLIRSSFKYWGAIPSFDQINTTVDVSGSYLPLNVLYDHGIDAPIQMNDYFHHE
ncbi:hypothetical protein A3860_26725 [Niastella vici]|uniref:Uncharacterized protein n=1 Tax=Niastella vici TaxID=1703345 RepID=A0A1V9FXD9_9BACT|nr:hypothetical protein [Niastella vici]OQP62906.1 hypothetical protein A3860_26725 [Niastella vici]